jgi:hypothetical protein
MTFLSALGEFPEMVLGLAFSFGCALLLAFICLRFLLGLMTRQQVGLTQDAVSQDHNVISDSSRVRSILWFGAAVAGPKHGSAGADHGSELGSGSVATGGPYLLPAAAPRPRFTRIAEPDAAPASRVVELPQAFAGRITPSECRDGWGGDHGGAA